MFKEGNTKKISLHKMICTLPAVPSTTSNSLQRVCYCIDYFVCIYCMCMYCTYAFEFIYVHACMCECMLGSTQRYEMYGVHNVNALESLIYIHKVGVIGNRT